MRYVAAESTQERASLFSHFRHGPRHKVVEWWMHYFHLFFYVFFLKVLILKLMQASCMSDARLLYLSFYSS